MRLPSTVDQSRADEPPAKGQRTVFAPTNAAFAVLVTSTRLRMANNGFTFISLRGEDAYINDSRVVATDVVAANGIIHVIDAVLLP